MPPASTGYVVSDGHVFPEKNCDALGVGGLTLGDFELGDTL